MIAVIVAVAIMVGLGAAPAAAMSVAPGHMPGHAAMAMPAAPTGKGCRSDMPAVVPPCCALGMCLAMPALLPVPVTPIRAKLPAGFVVVDRHVPAGLDLLPALPPPRSPV